MKFSLCIEPVFTGHPFYDRIRLAAACGLDAIEFWDPSGYDAARVGRLAAAEKLDVAAIGLCDSWGVRMNAGRGKVLQRVEDTIRAGRDIGCGTFIALGGETMCRADSQKSLLIENLRRVGDLCEKNGVTVVLEPLNSLYDHKGYYLDSSYIGFEIVRCVDNPHVKLLYDCYHMQIMEGNLVNSIRENAAYIGHFHSAGVPGRHELTKGETNYPFVIAAAEAAGYDRYFGFEYWPTYDDETSVRDTLAYVKGQAARAAT